jgi:hypothetical protein
MNKEDSHKVAQAVSRRTPKVICSSILHLHWTKWYWAGFLRVFRFPYQFSFHQKTHLCRLSSRAETTELMRREYGGTRPYFNTRGVQGRYASLRTSQYCKCCKRTVDVKKNKLRGFLSASELYRLSDRHRSANFSSNFRG